MYVLHNDPKKKYDWKDCKLFLAKPDALLKDLLEVDFSKVPKETIDKLKQHMAKNPSIEFTYESIATKSKPCASIVEYILNLIGASET